LTSFPRKLLDKVREIKAALRRDDCRLGVLTGPPRRGKSTLKLQLARLVDDNFTIDRVTFNADTFKVACVEAPPGSAVSLDEAIKGGNARRAMSEENVGMMNWLTIWGHRNLLGLIAYPKWSRLDPAIKDFVNFRIHIPVRGIAIWYDVYHPDRAKDAVLIERFRFRFNDLPEGEFRTAYQAKKTEFTKKESKGTKDGRAKLTAKQRGIMVWLVTKQGKTHDEVARQFKVSRPYVSQLVKQNQK